jgi:predicted dehydrogenase
MSRKILIVGCGSIGERHVRCLKRTGRAEVIVCENRQSVLERVQRAYQVEGFINFDDALKSRPLDGVVICTPAHTHIPLALLALRAGAALLIEKPLSTNLERIDELQTAIERSGRYVGIAYVYHFMPAFGAAKTFLDQGKLGKPLQVSVVAGQHFPTFRPAYREIYYTRHETGGGAIQDALTHLVNTVEWLIGPTTRISCEARHQLLEGIEVEDTVSASARNGDVLVTYSLNQFQAPNEMAFQIHCENGSLAVDVHHQRWSFFLRSGSGWQFHPAPLAERDDLYLAQVHAFLDGIEGKPNPLCTLEEAIHTLKVNLAALESARTGQVVNIL